MGITNHLLTTQYLDGETTILDILGLRGVNGKLKDDGAINVIVGDWKTSNR